MPPLMVGRATAWRNIFGTDAQVLDQSLAIARGGYTASDRLDLNARASRIRTGDLQEFTFNIADSDQGGGGVRFVLTPAIHLVADGSIVSYRRRGSDRREVDASALAGASVLLSKGWIQVNVSRFSPGELPILTQPLADRQTFFAAAEYDVFKRIRMHGGWEAFKSNLDPEGAAAAGQRIPTNDGVRSFAGVRVPLGVQSSIGARYEDGDRRSRYIRASAFRVSDTGVFSSEYQNTIGMVNTFVRYARRENVETESLAGTYTQHDSSALAFVNVSRTLQFFGSATAMRNTQQTGEGSSFFQYGGGGQAQLITPGALAARRRPDEPQRRCPQRPNGSSRPVQFWPEWRNHKEHDHRPQRLRRPLLHRGAARNGSLDTSLHAPRLAKFPIGRTHQHVGARQHVAARRNGLGRRRGVR